MGIHLERRGEVFVLTMDDGENRMNRPWLDAFNRALDEVDATQGPKALVTTGSGKFFSNGLDLEPLMALGAEKMAAFVAEDERLFARIIKSPYIAVAACNGHTFAAGAMLALCHDFRVMRTDRGFFCLPEVDLGIPFSPGMDALIKSRLPQTVAHQVMVTGTRYGGEHAAALGIVDEATSAEELVARATAIAAELAHKAGPVMGAIKERMYADLIALLEASPGTVAPGM